MRRHMRGAHCLLISDAGIQPAHMEQVDALNGPLQKYFGCLFSC
jgi:hypothetical protein